MIEGENNSDKNTQNREGRGMLMMAMTSGTEQDEGMVLRRVVETRRCDDGNGGNGENDHTEERRRR